ncbi:UNVERIFIED_CONTAM: hypothetical protein K2H54_065363 [Gekko kuhli]
MSDNFQHQKDSASLYKMQESLTWKQLQEYTHGKQRAVEPCVLERWQRPGFMPPPICPPGDTNKTIRGRIGGEGGWLA